MDYIRDYSKLKHGPLRLLLRVLTMANIGSSSCRDDVPL